MTIPALGTIIPDGAISEFPAFGNYGAALLSKDGSRRIVQGGFFQVSEYVMPYHLSHISHFYGWYFWHYNDELYLSDFNDIVRYLPHPEQAGQYTVNLLVMPHEPVNPAPDFWNWREHLSNLAHDFQLGHRYDRLAMRAVDTRRYAGQPSLTSTEEQTRNGNITQHSREMLGWLWQQIHIMSRMSHNDDWRAFREWLRPWIEGYCACFDARGALDRIHVGHDFLVWEKSLRLHERFIPDFSSYPFGVIRVPDVLPVTDAVSVLDLRNFGNAVDFFGNSDADTIRDVWPDGLLSVSEMIQHPVPVSVPSLADTGQQDLVDYWQEQWFNLRTYTDYSGPAGTRAYRAYVELQLLAILRNANWSNVDNIRKMDAAKWGAFDYAELSGSENPISAIFANRVDYWFDGYQYYDGTMLVRDEVPYDPADPLTAPFEAAMSLADPRVSTYVVVVDRDEIDRTASGIPSTHPWDILLDADGNPTGDSTGTPAQAYWQGRIDEILGAYP